MSRRFALDVLEDLRKRIMRRKEKGLAIDNETHKSLRKDTLLLLI